jgi:hypothetical protein
LVLPRTILHLLLNIIPDWEMAVVPLIIWLMAVI